LPKKKENILGKIVQKDYNNVLEKVIETKDFDEDVKNLLLGILYKIDVAYKDYKKVTRTRETKQEYIEKIINTIKNNCETIKIVRSNSKEIDELEKKTFFVDKKNKKIICYPVERKLLYSISKIAKQEVIIRNKYFLINQTISDLINIGNNINTVEPLRDFNGWSWLIIRKEIENISYNLIYQNLKILVGEQFLNSWITNTEYVIDYYDEFQNELTEKFGVELKEELVSVLEKISILLEVEINIEFQKNLEQLIQENNEKLSKFQNNEEFFERLTEDKKQINRRLKKIEQMLGDKDLLSKEYIKTNKKLSAEEKIFSIKIIEKRLKKEKQILLEQLDEKNELLNPKKFMNEKIKLEKRNELLKVVEVQNKSKEKIKLLEEFQKLFLQCFLELIKTAETKEKIIDLIYIFRYYNLQPFDEKTDINQNLKIQESIITVKEELLKKAIDYKLILTPSEDIEENIKLLHFIFQTKIMSIEDIYISIIKEKDKYYIEFSEDNESTYEEKFEIDTIKKEKLSIKLNKKSKILN